MPTQYERDRARAARGVSIAAWVRKEKKAARVLAITPKNRGVAPTKTETTRTARGLAANKGKGIQFADQKVDAGGVKDLRSMQAKRRTQANRPSRKK